MRSLGVGILLVLVLVIDNICLTLGSLVLAVRHSSTVAGIHVGREASRQLCSDLEFIRVGQDRLLLTGGRGIERIPGITSTIAGRRIRLHIGRVDLSRILTARHGRGRAGFLQDGEVSVLILKVPYRTLLYCGSGESCHGRRILQQRSRHEFCLNELTLKTSGCSTTARPGTWTAQSGSNRARQPAGERGVVAGAGLGTSAQR